MTLYLSQQLLSPSIAGVDLDGPTQIGFGLRVAPLLHQSIAE